MLKNKIIFLKRKYKSCADDKIRQSYLQSSGTNGEQQGDEKEEDKSDGSTSHVVFLCIQNVAWDISSRQVIWI